MPKYFSKNVCEKHPDLNGLRWVGNRRCIKCDAERLKRRMQERRGDPESRTAENLRLAVTRRERYASDPEYAERERVRCREAIRARRAASKSA